VKFQLVCSTTALRGCRCGKPTYKSMTKAEAMREEKRPREQDAPSIPMEVSPVKPAGNETPLCDDSFAEGTQQIRSSSSLAAVDERRNLIQFDQTGSAEALS